MNIFDTLGQQTVDKRIDILQRINSLGSISKAAKSAGISYKAAWQAIETLNNLAGTPLVEKIVGGNSGGGARLTQAGLSVLEASAALNKVRSQIFMDIEKGEAPKLASLAASTLRMSVRNILPCVIENIDPQISQVKLRLRVANNCHIRSSITLESYQLLGLKVGMGVLALFKATAAHVVKEAPQIYNGEIFNGQIARLPRNQESGEVTLRLSNGLNVVGFVNEKNDFRIGEEASLLIDETSVIIGLM